MHLECNFYHEINKFQLKYKPFPVSLLSLIIYQSQIEVLRSQAQGIDELDKKSVMIKLSDKGYQNADYINLNIVMDVIYIQDKISMSIFFGVESKIKSYRKLNNR